MLKRLFSLEPAALGAAASAVYLAAAMLYRAYVLKTGVFEPDLVVAAVTLVWGIWTRLQVTPLGRPRDKYGRALTPNQRM